MTPEEQRQQVISAIAKACKMPPERVVRAVAAMKADGLSFREAFGVFQEIARAHGGAIFLQDDLLQTTGQAAFAVPMGGKPS